MRVAGAIEFEITAQSEEHVEGEMPIQPGILNPFGIPHAGAILWFADVCATVLVAGKPDFEPGAAGFPLGVQLSAHFVGHQRDGVFKATSRFVKRGRRLSIVRTTLTGQGGRLLADVTTTHIPALPPTPAESPR